MDTSNSEDRLIAEFSDRLDQPCLVGSGYHGQGAAVSWRGLLLDSARTRHSVVTIKKLLLLMQRYGFNCLHWHLTDDQGWRLPIEAFPRLLSVGAQLPRGDFYHYLNLYRDTAQRSIAEAPTRWHNGYYTRTEISEVVSFALEHGISVMPELDLPGHMAAAIASYPELGMAAVLQESQGPDAGGAPHLEDDLLRFTPAAEDFLEACLTEVARIFPINVTPAGLIHIGGDECQWARWDLDEVSRERARGLGLQTGASIQAYFMDLAQRLLRENGRNVGCWDEVVDTGFSSADLLFAWHEKDGVRRAEESNNSFVFADSNSLYFNRVNPDVSGEQKGMTPPLSLRDVYEANWAAVSNERCVGVQAAIWCEFVLDEADLFQMLFPRLLAVSERLSGESVAQNAPWEEFQERAQREEQHLRAALE